jgi:hypothetical protein
MSDETYDDKTGEFTVVKQGDFSYRDILKQIITGPSGRQDGANTSEEVVKSVLLYGKIKEALKKGEKSVLLDKEDYDYVMERMKTFKWAIAHQVISDFITYMKELKEVTVEEVKEVTEEKPAA